ncbi:MAG: type II toxin-antitoxin system PemK/MazF family toxin [Chitinivibrionales bacterium]|nr:type II toxin-antitoxin system PemK/MazF family toxin [Chitinivibrionales bacterium]
MLHYIPKKGDFIALSFDPQSGHEQKGRRPALVISNDLFNQKIGLALVCPVTNTDRKMPFHIKLPENSALTGFIMVEQIKSIDFTARRAKFIDKAPAPFLADVLAILDAVIY